MTKEQGEILCDLLTDIPFLNEGWNTGINEGRFRFEMYFNETKFYDNGKLVKTLSGAEDRKVFSDFENRDLSDGELRYGGDEYVKYLVTVMAPYAVDSFSNFDHTRRDLRTDYVKYLILNMCDGETR